MFDKSYLQYTHMNNISEYNNEEFINGLKYEFFVHILMHEKIKVYPEDGIVYNPITNYVYNKPNNRGYISVSYNDYFGNAVHMLVHNVIWWYVNGPAPIGYRIFHIDNNLSNNSIYNLDIKTKKIKIREPKLTVKEIAYPQDPNCINTIRKEIKKGDYRYALVPEHPNATKNGYVLYHRAVMENYLGRYLEDYEEVHHIDENRYNNDISNLELTLSGKHQKYHLLQRGRTYLKLKCPQCGIVFDKLKCKTHIDTNTKIFTSCSISCGTKFSNTIKKLGINHPNIQKALQENILYEYNQ